MYVNSKRKEVKPMTYETPTLTALMPAINAIQGIKNGDPQDSATPSHDVDAAYEDWE